MGTPPKEGNTTCNSPLSEGWSQTGVLKCKNIDELRLEGFHQDKSLLSSRRGVEEMTLQNIVFSIRSIVRRTPQGSAKLNLLDKILLR